MRSYWVYMLRCQDGSYYVGHTADLTARLWEHEQGLGLDWTRRRRPVVLVWCEEMPTKSEALAAERRIKGWSVKKKLALIDRDWRRISQLAHAKDILTRPKPRVGNENRPRPEPVEGRRRGRLCSELPPEQTPFDMLGLDAKGEGTNPPIVTSKLEGRRDEPSCSNSIGRQTPFDELRTVSKESGSQ